MDSIYDKLCDSLKKIFQTVLEINGSKIRSRDRDMNLKLMKLTGKNFSKPIVLFIIYKTMLLTQLPRM